MVKKTLLGSIGLSIILGGCSSMNSTNINNENEEAKESQAALSSDRLVSVQDYSGEGYALPYGKETDKLAEKTGLRSKKQL